jgi:hypothetical protein
MLPLILGRIFALGGVVPNQPCLHERVPLVPRQPSSKFPGSSAVLVGYPKSQGISCAPTVPIDTIEETVTAGSSTLSYDLSTDTYTYCLEDR